MKIYVSNDFSAQSANDDYVHSMPYSEMMLYDLVIGRSNGAYNVVKSRYTSQGLRFNTKSEVAAFVLEYIESYA